MPTLIGDPVQLTSSGAGTSPKGARLADLASRMTGGGFATGVVIDSMTNVVTGTPGMSYSVRPCAVQAKFTDEDGPTRSVISAAETVATDPAPATNSRIDSVYALQKRVTGDGGSGGDDNSFIIGVAKSDPDPSPLPPAIPAGAVRLADIRVTALATATNTLTITQRHAWVPAVGGIVPDAKGSTSGKVWNGTEWSPIWFGDTGWVTLALGSNWNVATPVAAYCRVRVRAGRVELEGFANKGSGGNYFVPGSLESILAPSLPVLPAELRPSRVRPLKIFADGAKPMQGIVSVAGAIQLAAWSGLTGNPSSSPTNAYFAGEWDVV